MAMTIKFYLPLILLISQVVVGHNWLSSPQSRGDQMHTQTGCRYGGEGNPTCAGPCDRTVGQINQAPTQVQRGQTLHLTWNRHNHPGGFVRFAWSPTSSSDSHASFDQHVDHIVCKEIGGCGPADRNSPTGAANGVDCGTTVTVPTYLTNGLWTLQWAYFGGWWNAGDYYACVDYQVTGGPTGTQQPAYFQGGDYTYPNQDVCLFYSTNALHVCTVEPCLNGTFPPGDQRGAALGLGGQVPVTTGRPQSQPTPPPAPITTGRISTGRITTGRITTGRQSNPVGSSSSSSSTTSRTQPTQPPAPISTGAPATPVSSSSSSSGDSTSCTTGYMRCMTSETYQTCAHSAWGPSQSCGRGTSCHPSGNYIYCY